jgi:gamma-glutamyltranspeptidase/glutathione hydrolase
MTTTIEDVFGARLMVRGFLLNNQLTDFSFVPQADGLPVANRVQPGKRPRSERNIPKAKEEFGRTKRTIMCAYCNYRELCGMKTI